MSTRIDTPEPDRTPRRGRLEALRASEQLLDRTLAALDQAVLVVDPITRTIGSANPAVERVFGYRPTSSSAGRRSSCTSTTTCSRR